MMKYWCDVGHFNLDQANYFIELLNVHNPNYVLETGFCTGRSAVSLLCNSNNIKKMISIDINFNYRKPQGNQYRKLLIDNFNNFYTIEGDSKKIINDNFLKTEFPNGIDWFTVDGDHSYYGCLTDIELVYKHMNKGGIIIIDDYKSGPPNGCSIPDVTNACDDFHKKHPDIKKITWNKDGKGFCVFLF